MTTFTAIAFDRLIEQGPPKSFLKPPTVQKLEKQCNSSTEKGIHRAYISPALYATPEATPVPDSPTSFVPSPYIVNHKRRGPHLLKSLSQNNVIECQQPNGKEKVDENGVDLIGDASCAGTYSCSSPNEEARFNGFHDKKLDDNNVGDGLVGVDEPTKSLPLDSERDNEGEDFFDLQDSVSIDSDVADHIAVECVWKQSLAEYFDACEELASEGTPYSACCNVEEELQETRLNLLMEIEKRKQAEEAFDNIQNQWRRIARQLSLVGLTLPDPSTGVAEKDQLPDLDPVKELCQQVVLARAVANAIGRGIARAEVEVQMESQLELKNFEINRLWDRIHYYQAVNHEMSQRNQEAVERTRQQRQRKKKRQRWVWCSIGLAVALGSAAFAWSYHPTAWGSSITNSSDASEGGAVTPPEQTS